MAISHSRATRLAFKVESTAGTPPSDWTTGTEFRHHNLDLSGLTQEVVADLRNQTRIRKHEQGIRGIRGGSFSFSIYAQGSGATTADASQITETWFMELLKYAVGDVQRGNSTTAKAAGSHSTTQVELTATTNLGIGSVIGVEDESTGLVYVREITALASDVATLDRPLPFTPSDGDAVHAIAQVHFDEGKIEDKKSASWTVSFLAQWGDDQWELPGCSVALTGVSIARGQPIELTFTVTVGTWFGPNDTSETFPSSSSGNAGPIAGVKTDTFYQDFGTTTESSIPTVGLEFNPGVNASEAQTITESTSNLQGKETYVSDTSAATFTLTRSRAGTTDYDDFDDSTEKVMRYAKIALPGSVFGIFVPRCEVRENPEPGEADNRRTVALTCHALERAANGSAVDADLWQSDFQLLVG